MEAITLKDKEPMMITWDTGRRCNFDCSYCDLSRHNLTSPLTPYNELLNTYKFIEDYAAIYNQKKANIAFTGGEPTVNPAFWQLIDQIHGFTLGLTTNGTFSKNKIDIIQKKFVAATISWHAEINEVLRNKALENALTLHKNNFDIRVNVMMHTDYWQESVNAYNMLVEQGVKTNPVIIGDGIFGDTDFFQDESGTLRRTSHPYTAEQQEWYFKIKGIEPTVILDIKSGNQLPRSCCGNRDLLGNCNGCWTDINAVHTNFQGWYCSVNKYFMHVEQHTGNVYHHQTCQAKFEGQKGPIGNLKNTFAILHYAKSNLLNSIVCPNSRCGCGMCAPKARDKIEFDRLVG